MLRSENRGTPGQVMNFSIDFRDTLRHLVFIAHLFFILGDFYSYSRGVYIYPYGIPEGRGGVEVHGIPWARGLGAFRNFQTHGGVKNRCRPWVGYGYFLELPNN